MAVREGKICLLGESGVGKSSLVLRYVKDTFNPAQDVTLGAALQIKTIAEGEHTRKYQIWDTAGQERFRCLTPMYYRGADVAILVYDITSQSSFTTVKFWVAELNKQGPPNIIICLAGNKCDLEDGREVKYEDAKKFADSIGAIFVETSAKTAVNVEAMFHALHKKFPYLERETLPGGETLKSQQKDVNAMGKCCAA